MDIKILDQQIKDGVIEGILFDSPLDIQVKFPHGNDGFVTRPIIAAGIVKEHGIDFLTVKYDGKINGCYGTTLGTTTDGTYSGILVKLPDGKTYDNLDEIYAILRSYKNDYVDLDDIVF